MTQWPKGERQLSMNAALLPIASVMAVVILFFGLGG